MNTDPVRNSLQDERARSNLQDEPQAHMKMGPLGDAAKRLRDECVRNTVQNEPRAHMNMGPVGKTSEMNHERGPRWAHKASGVSNERPW